MSGGFRSLRVGIRLKRQIEVLQYDQSAKSGERFFENNGLRKGRREICPGDETHESDEGYRNQRSVRVEILRALEYRDYVEKRDGQSEKRKYHGLRRTLESGENLGSYEKEQASEHDPEKQGAKKERLPIYGKIDIEKIEKVHVRELFGSNERAAYVSGSKSVDVFDAANEERELLVFGERERALVHDAEILSERHGTGNGIVADGVRIFRRILVVHAVDLSTLYEDVAMELERPEYRGGVGREIRVSRTSNRDDDTAVGEMFDCAALDEKLAYAIDFERAHDAHFPSVTFYRVTERDAVDNRREHSHVVTLRAVETLRRHGRPTKDIASADDDDDLFSGIRERHDFFRKRVEELDVDSVAYGTLEGFAGKFEKEALRVLNLHGREG